MPKIYKRKCDECSAFYENQNDRFCSWDCYNKNRDGKPRVFNAAVGPRHGRFNGYRTITQDGYVLITVGKRRMLEHRWVMEQSIGRPLEKDEDVHHVNQVKTDNRIENLQLMKKGEHTRLHNLCG